MKFFKSLRAHFMKWLIYNALTFVFLSIFYIPYNLWWLKLSSLQFLKWLLTAGAFGAVVNIVMRPYVSWIVRMLDRRYGKEKK